MGVFGWICLVAITCYGSFAVVAMEMMSFGFAGKSNGKLILIPVATVLILWYFVFKTFPFDISVKAP